MSKFVCVLLCFCMLLGFGGCHRRSARLRGYAAIKAKMSLKEVAGVLGLPGSGKPEKHRCGKCDVWCCAGFYIKGYAGIGGEEIQRFSIFTIDGHLLSDQETRNVDARISRLHPPMRYAAVCGILGGKGNARTLLAYSWKTEEGEVIVEFENGKAYHKQLIKANSAKEELELCPTAPLWDAPPPKA